MEKFLPTDTVAREMDENMRETTLQIPRSVKKEREEVLQVAEQGFPAAFVEAYGEADHPPAAHVGPQWSRDLPAMEKPTLEQMNAQKRL